MEQEVIYWLFPLDGLTSLAQCLDLPPFFPSTHTHTHDGCVVLHCDLSKQGLQSELKLNCNNSDGILFSFLFFAGCCLHTVDLWLQGSAFEFCRARLVHRALKSAGSEGSGQGCDPYKGSLSLTWTFGFVCAPPPLLPSPLHHLSAWRSAGQATLGPSRGPRSCCIKVSFRSIDLFVWLPLAADKFKRCCIGVGSICVFASALRTLDSGCLIITERASKVSFNFLKGAEGCFLFLECFQITPPFKTHQESIKMKKDKEKNRDSSSRQWRLWGEANKVWTIRSQSNSWSLNAPSEITQALR